MTQGSSRRRSQSNVGNSRDNSEGEQVSFKRRRIALACTSCRNRKTRCNGARPACRSCSQMGFECVYEQPSSSSIVTQPRARQDDRYEDRFKNIEDTLRQLVNQQSSGQRARHTSLDDRDETIVHSDQLTGDVAILSDGQYCLQDEDEDRVDGMATIADSNEKDSRYFGPSSNIALLSELSRTISYALRSRPRLQTDSTSTTEPRLVSRMQSPDINVTLATPRTQASTSLLMLPSEPQATAMIEHFFSDTGMLFPYISRVYVTETYRKARTKNFHGVKRSWLCLLNMIFAFATFTKITTDSSMEENILNSKSYFNRAQELLAESRLRLADLNSVQCLLLMSQYRQGTQRSDETWSLHASAVHSAIEIGLHCCPDQTRLSQFDIEVRKRTWYGCLVLDSTLSMTLGRPPSIPKEYTLLDPPLSQNLDELHPSTITHPTENRPMDTRTVGFFIATIDLYIIQNDVILNLYHNNLSPQLKIEPNEALSHIIPIEIALTRWETELGPELKLKPWTTTAATATTASNDPVFERLSVIIRLRYLHTKLIAHQVVLRLVSREMQDAKSDALLMPESFLRRTSRESILSCVFAACEIIEIVYTMSSVPKKLGSWWFTIYYTFHATLVLVSCLIYHFESLRKGRSALFLPSGPTNVQDFESVLPKALKAIEQVGQGTRSSRRICRTLTKLQQMYACIAQPIPLESTAPLTTPAIMQQENMQEQVRFGNMDMTNTTSGDIAVDASTVQPQVFEPDFSDFWMQGDLDIFANLGGLDVGLSSILTA